jgi:hypothetical protein
MGHFIVTLVYGSGDNNEIFLVVGLETRVRKEELGKKS